MDSDDSVLDDASRGIIGELLQSPHYDPPWGDVLRLWTDTADSLGKFQTVVGTASSIPIRSLRKAKYALELAYRYRAASIEARAFADKYMVQIVAILLEQRPGQLDEQERVEKLLMCSLAIVNEDLKAMLKIDTCRGAKLEKCTTLDTLWNVLQEDNVYYEGQLFQVCCFMLGFFQRSHGFTHIAAYLKVRASTCEFPRLDTPHMPSFLRAMCNYVLVYSDVNTLLMTQAMRDVKIIAEACMKQVIGLSEETLNEMNLNVMKELRCNLYRIFIQIAEYDPMTLLGDFFVFWRSWILKLITFQHLQLKLFGWDEMKELVKESNRMCPPPRAYIVSGAGTSFINGQYELDPDSLMQSGCVEPSSEFVYQRKVPIDDPDIEGAGKTLTLFRCTMRSQHKWWCLSEVDEEQPGTDRDTDFYVHMSKKFEERLPSLYGWRTYSGVAVDPPPTLKPSGLIVSEGEENNVLDILLAKWAIDNEIAELALGGSTDSEIVKRSTELIKFLAGTDFRAGDSGICFGECAIQLKPSHILLAWETCMETTNITLLVNMYVMLVSIYNSMSEDLRSLSNPIIKSLMILRVQRSDPSLLNLHIGNSLTTDPCNVEVGKYDVTDDADFAKLGYSIAKNTQLQVVQFDHSFTLEGVSMVMANGFLDGLKRNKSIRSLSLKHCNISGSDIIDILNCFGERQTSLSELLILHCGLGNENGGVQALTLSLQKHTALKVLFRGTNHQDFIAAIRAVETLDLNGNNISATSCHVIADMLGDARCNIVTLQLDQNHICDRSATILASALAKNDKLETISIDYNHGARISRIGWKSFSQALCNTSSINAMYLSNHTLSCIVASLPASVFHYLHMNRGPNKRHIAMRKILQHCPHFDMTHLFEWDLKLLPVVFDWFNEARACAEINEANIKTRMLSAVHQFVRAMP